MEKKQILFIHGGDSFSRHEDFINHLKTTPLRDPLGESGSDRWNKHLRDDLSEECELFQPTMPNWQNAKYEEWRIWFERHLEHIKPGAIFAGWSLGGMFLLKYFSEQEITFKPKALLVIASPAGSYEIDTEPGNDCKSFQFSLVGLSKIEETKVPIAIFHSKDDFVVPYEHALKLKEALPAAELVTFEDRNHFLQPEFPELVDMIKKL